MGDFNPTYSTDNIWRGEEMEQCLTDDLDAIEADIAALQTGKANTSHTHSGYAVANHTHSGYASSAHTHSNYALASDLTALQTQVGDYSVSQQISTAIASKADVNHTHTGYAANGHTHTVANVAGLVDELGDKYEKPSGGIPKSDLASDIQASLSKADSAIQSLSGYATESYVNTKVADLVDTAPDALNTLNELAAALGDDPNFATTIAIQIGSKASQVALDSLATLVGDASVATQIASAVATKADSNHTHTEYAASSHSHTGYAATNHEHTDYADVDHTHSSYAASNHTHDGYALSTHGHAGYATSSDISALQTLVGDTAVSTQISNAVASKADTNHTHSVSTTSAAGFMSSADKTKLNGIATGANKTTVDSALSSSSTNPVQNKVINAALNNKRIFKNIASIGITTFPTTMKLIAEAMPDDSMLILDTRRINGLDTANSTETISDWGNSSNGVALIFRGISTARVSMLILYGTTQCTYSNIQYGSYAYEADRVNWSSLKDKLDDKVDKVSHLSGVDLDTVTESGLYYVSSGTTDLHYPAGSNGHMLVMSDGTRVRQVYFRVGTVDTNNFQWYSRHLGSDLTVGDNGWSKWWLMSASERIFSGTAKLNAEINLGSRYGCQAWVIAGNVTDTGTVSTVYVPRYFLTTNQTKYKLQITDETGYVSFYFYYKESDDNVYAKVIWVSDVNNSAIKYAYRVS